MARSRDGKQAELRGTALLRGLPDRDLVDVARAGEVVDIAVRLLCR